MFVNIMLVIIAGLLVMILRVLQQFNDNFVFFHGEFIKMARHLMGRERNRS